MRSGFAVDPGLLLVGVLLLVGALASTLTSQARIPSLLLFLGLGMLVADDGLALVRFDNAALAQNVATVALVLILFEGGLATDPRAFRSMGLPAGLLATVGVAVTAGIVAGLAWLVADLDATTPLLLGAVVASTDAAAVFAALRSESLPLRLQQLLQLESGLNDPVAVLLTIGAVEAWRSSPSAGQWITFLGVQLGGGLLVGVTVGWVGQRLVSRVSGSAASSLAVFTLGVAAISYGTAALLGASGFLAVYLTGAMVARGRRAVRAIRYFHEALAATAHAGLFLLLGILVFPSRLLDDLRLGVIIAAGLVLVARPVAVFSVLAWWRTPSRQMVVVSWAGLRGAVPVVLATIPFTAAHPDGALIFDVAFVVVVLSVAVQAPTVGALARRLGVVTNEPVAVRPEILPLDALDADLVEVTIPARSRLEGRTLGGAPLPGGARVSLVRRGGTSLVPDGNTPLAVGDVLLILASRQVDLDALEDWARQ